MLLKVARERSGWTACEVMRCRVWLWLWSWLSGRRNRSAAGVCFCRLPPFSAVAAIAAGHANSVSLIGFVLCLVPCLVLCGVRGRDQSRSCLLADSSSAVASTTALPSQALVDTSRLRPRRHQPRWRLGRSGVTSETGAVAPISQEIDRAAYPRELPTVWGG